MRLSLLGLLLATPLAAQRPVPALVEEYDRIAPRAPWPGFAPLETPLAVFDGERTWLLRHPSPPAEFAPAPGRPALRVASGQHAAVRGNTHADLGGVATATLLWPDRPVDLTRLAATLLHEAFHVHQARARPAWVGNEATLFTYPVTDSSAQWLQRLETEAFRRAAGPGGAAACWTSRALELRRARAEQVGAEAMAYERGNDLNEGLATWIEWRASGAPVESLIPAAGFLPDGVRLRAYAVGPVQAFLLDRLRHDWVTELAADSALTLDVLLERAVASLSCRADFTRAELDSVARLAGQETSAVLARRLNARQAFLARDGWEVTIRLPPSRPLWPQRFDPWNLTPLPEGEVLHQRHLRLGGEAGQLEVLDQWALTRAAGEHPLFNGVREVVIAGLAERPSLTSRGDTLLVRAPGVEGMLVGLVAGVEGRRITLRPR